ncbi:MAG: hypothetical protein H7243_12395 [Sphingomonadaceae bacterium]|nr:hypothetical protein [Sphingomonadaceae bacterium]
MSAAVHLLLIVSTIIAAGVAWMVAGLMPAAVLNVATAIVGGLLYIRPLGLDDAPATSSSLGGTDAG